MVGFPHRWHYTTISILAVNVAAGPVLSPVPTGFTAAHPGLRVTGPQVQAHPASQSRDSCAAACLAQPCIAFNWIEAATGGAPTTRRPAGGAVAAGSACELSSWGPEYIVLPNASSTYFTKTLARNDTAATPAIAYLAKVPVSGVQLIGGPFSRAFDTNLAYLNQFPVDDMLYWFRRRARVPNPSGATSWGWDGAVEPTGTHVGAGAGASAGRAAAGVLDASHAHILQAHAPAATASQSPNLQLPPHDHALHSHPHGADDDSTLVDTSTPQGRNVDGPYGLRGSVVRLVSFFFFVFSSSFISIITF